MHYEQYLLENPNIDISNAKYIYDYAHKNALVCQLKESHFIAWQAAKAQAIPDGFVLVHKYHQQNIRDALVIACDVQEDEQRFEDSLNYVHKAMIEAQEQSHDN